MCLGRKISMAGNVGSIFVSISWYLNLWYFFKGGGSNLDVKCVLSVCFVPVFKRDDPEIPNQPLIQMCILLLLCLFFRRRMCLDQRFFCAEARM